MLRVARYKRIYELLSVTLSLGDIKTYGRMPMSMFATRRFLSRHVESFMPSEERPSVFKGPCDTTFRHSP